MPLAKNLQHASDSRFINGCHSSSNIDLAATREHPHRRPRASRRCKQIPNKVPNSSRRMHPHAPRPQLILS